MECVPIRQNRKETKSQHCKTKHGKPIHRGNNNIDLGGISHEDKRILTVDRVMDLIDEYSNMAKVTEANE